jgi:hypothetical protein
MGLCKSTTERANDMNNTQREVASKKNSNAGKVARQLKEDFVNQVALLVEEVKSVAATEKAQAAVAKQVADTIKMMQQRIKEALEKANEDREKAIKDLETIRIQSLKTSMNCMHAESVNEQ